MTIIQLPNIAIQHSDVDQDRKIPKYPPENKHFEPNNHPNWKGTSSSKPACLGSIRSFSRAINIKMFTSNFTAPQGSFCCTLAIDSQTLLMAFGDLSWDWCRLILSKFHSKWTTPIIPAAKLMRKNCIYEKKLFFSFLSWRWLICHPMKSTYINDPFPKYRSLRSPDPAGNTKFTSRWTIRHVQILNQLRSIVEHQRIKTWKSIQLWWMLTLSWKT